jgi:hypothetical protein
MMTMIMMMMMHFLLACLSLVMYGISGSDMRIIILYKA